MSDVSESPVTRPQGVLAVPSSRLAWLDLLRAMAVLLVLWNHLVGAVLTSHKISWPLSDWADQYFFDPLAIRQQGGFLGVCIFFLISGYIITRILGKETALQFAVRRLLRIFPLLLIVALTVWLLGYLNIPGMPADAYEAPFAEVFRNGFLLNYITHPQVILVGPAWSLVIEVCFYLLALLLLPALRARHLHPVCLPVAMLVVTGLSVFLSRNLGTSFFLLSVSLSYLPILAIGSLFYLYEASLISTRMALVLAGLAWITFLVAAANIYPQFMAASMESYPISVMASIAIFCLCFAKREDFHRLPVAMAWVALPSYSIYLWHGVVAVPLEHALLPRIGFTASLMVSVVVLVLVALLSYICIEKPCQALAKKIV